MGIPPGTRIGAYTISASIGAGGMGEVYRARDTRLDRDVAIKILPPAFAADPERVARFEGEAKILASLNHPNIAQIFGIAGVDGLGTQALVMELVDGEDLSAIMARGPLPVPEALGIARQVADALEAAHARGIVHRDLKPGNIKVAGNGRVKVLDFGLAKATANDLSSQDAMNSPTIAAPKTALGAILGTAAYMAPEQARGKAVDRRADVWAFGVVLYEMLTGRRAFAGEDLSEILAAVLRDSVALETLPADTPAAVHRLLRRCLQRDPARRLDSMGAARLEIDDATASPSDVGAARARTSARARFVKAWPVVAAALVGALAVVGVTRMWPQERPAPVRRLALPLSPEAERLSSTAPDVAVSADGRRVFYLAFSGKTVALIARSLDRFEEQAVPQLTATSASFTPSPDGEWIAFIRGNAMAYELAKVAVAGGTPIPLTPLQYEWRGGSWGDDGAILYATEDVAAGIMRVRDGAAAETLTVPNTAEGELDHLWPHVLPDGTHALFVIQRRDRTSDVAVLDLSSRSWRVLVPKATMPKYAASGHLLYAAGGALHAAGYDARRHRLTTKAIELVSGVAQKPSLAASYDISRDGTLVYMPGRDVLQPRALLWVDERGGQTPFEIGPKHYREIQIAPDGRRVAATIEEDGVTGLWVLDPDRQTTTRLTPPGLGVSSPVWSADGLKLAMAVTVATSLEPGIYELPASGAGALRRLTTTTSDKGHFPTAWNADGTEVLFYGALSDQGDILRVRVGSKPEPVLATSAVEFRPALSPDGRWLAYVSNEGGQLNVFVRPYPNVNDGRVAVSSNGGMYPTWTAGGKVLMYTAGPAVWAVPVTATGKTLTLGKATPAMSWPAGAGGPWSVAANGSRHLVTMRPAEVPPRREFRVVLNVFGELNARVQK